MSATVLTCPYCKHKLTPKQVARLRAVLHASQRQARRGWPKGVPRKVQPPNGNGKNGGPK